MKRAIGLTLVSLGLGLVTFAAGINAATDPQTVPAQPAAASQASLTVPTGTKLLVQLTQNVSTNKKAAGTKFICLLQGNLEVNGQVIATDGAKVYGTVQKVTDPEGKTVMALVLDQMMINGQVQPIVTHPLGTAAPNVAGAAAAGAVKGAVVGSLVRGHTGGGHGGAAMVGAMAGAAKAKNSAGVAAGTLAEFYLAQPLVVAGK